MLGISFLPHIIVIIIYTLYVIVSILDLLFLMKHPSDPINISSYLVTYDLVTYDLVAYNLVRSY